MSVHEIDALPDGSRLWVFGASRPLEEEDVTLLRRRMPPFLAEWTAHRRTLRAAWDLREDRFLLIAVDETGTEASGCSIDALMRHLAGLEEALGATLLDSTPIWHRGPDGTIAAVARSEFRRLAAEGELTDRTPVFDPTLSTLGQLRAGRLERPAGRSWHARLLPDGSSAGAGSDSS